MDKLGEDPEINVYWVKECAEAVRIDPSSPEFGMFFSGENYIIDI